MKNLDVQSSSYKQLDDIAIGALVAGDLITVGIVNCFPIADRVVGDGYIAITESENVKAVKAVGAIGAGVAIYWVNANKNVATTGDILIGHSKEAALSADATVSINFDGMLAFAKL